MKFKASYGSSASPAIVAQVEAELAKVLRDGVPALPPRAELIHSLDVRTPYLETLERAGRLGSPARFAIPLRHRSDARRRARTACCELFRRHGIEADEIRGTRDPLFGGVNPEPIEPHVEALRRAVLEGSYDAGFALDGDADRIGAIGPRRHVHHARTRFSRFCSGISPARASSPATWPKHSPPPR